MNYGGTSIGLKRKFGFSDDKAKFIEDSHHEMYKVYYSYVKDKVNQAKIDGYVTLAFGLRLRTPVLKASNETNIPSYIIEQEERSVGNALFQSYGLMTLNALSNIMNEVWDHPVYFDRIVPVSTIYDSLYFELDNDLDQLVWLNKVIVRNMKDITEIPELHHPELELGADVEVLYPDWSSPIKIKNGASKEDVINSVKEWKSKHKIKGK